MRILISSHIPIDKTGYGVQTLNMARMFSKMGHSIVIIGWNMKIPNIRKYNFTEISIMLRHNFNIEKQILSNEDRDLLMTMDYYPALDSKYPVYINDTQRFEQLLDEENIDIIVFHQDIYPLQFHKKLTRKTICCLPVHYQPIDYITSKSLLNMDINIGLCDFGVETIKKCSKAPCYKIPLSINSDLMYYDTTHSKDYYRDLFHLPKNKFICLIVSNNSEPSNRKAFDIQIDAFKYLLSKHKDVYLYLHTQIIDGQDLNVYLNSISPEYYSYVDQDKYKKAHYSADDMANLFRASDVLLFASKSEGFGIPLIEAQACGCPVLTNNFSSMKELTHNGICCEPLKKIYNKEFKSYWSMPSLKKVQKGLEKIYKWTPDEREKYQQLGIQFTNNYSQQAIHQLWEQLFTSISVD